MHTASCTTLAIYCVLGKISTQDSLIEFPRLPGCIPDSQLPRGGKRRCTERRSTSVGLWACGGEAPCRRRARACRMQMPTSPVVMQWFDKSTASLPTALFPRTQPGTPSCPHPTPGSKPSNLETKQKIAGWCGGHMTEPAFYSCCCVMPIRAELIQSRFCVITQCRVSVPKASCGGFPESQLHARVFAQDTGFMLASAAGPGLLPSPRVLSHGPDVNVELLQGPGELDRRGLARPRTNSANLRDSHSAAVPRR